MFSKSIVLMSQNIIFDVVEIFLFIMAARLVTTALGVKVFCGNTHAC